MSWRKGAEYLAAGATCLVAGSLGLGDIDLLLPLRSDYLGFRTALCGGERTGKLDAEAFAAVRAALPRPWRPEQRQRRPA